MVVDGAEAVPSRPARFFCPVATCPSSDPARAPGWASVHNMLHHIDSHLAGTLQGDVPANWLQTNGRQRCRVCGLSVSTRHEVHPTCRPQDRAGVGGGAQRADDPTLPSFHDIQVQSAAMPAALELAPDLVGQVLRDFPTDTAPGACGLRVQHLREAGSPGDQQTLISHLTAVVNLMVQGQVCADAAPVLAGAVLVAVPKPKGGVRPIAIGEVLRRLVGKCLMRSVREDAAITSAQLKLESGYPLGLKRLSTPPALGCGGGGCGRGPFSGPRKMGGVVLWATDLALRASPLDLALFFLDDGVIAGDVADVGQALSEVQRRGAALGLQLNLSKCEVVGVGRLDADMLRSHLPDELLFKPDGTSRLQWNFELLGAAVGDVTFHAIHATSCAGHCRVVHSMRCCPPRGLSPALQLFDSSVRDCFAALTGLHLDAAQWEQAARALSYAGLGLRSTTADAPAAFLASLGACLDTCRAIDPSYADAGLAVEVEVVEAVDALNRNRAAPLAAHLALGMKQKSLTAATDEASWVRQLASCSLTSRALLRSEAEPGARAFLAATPSGPKRIETALFVTELRQRLGVPDAAADAWCPKCDGVLDALSLHAATCSATMQFATCSAGGLSEREAGNALRRPADVYLPCLRGSPAALDLAITAAQQQETLAQAGNKALAAAQAYAQHKAAHLDTARLCESQGIKFLPMVVESSDAWEPAASKVLLQISRAAAARTGADAALLHADLLQELCVTIRAHRARAVLRRRAELVDEAPLPCWQTFVTLFFTCLPLEILCNGV
ncbi:unnamed protein product [Symbiodinium natans]|uniref:Reverse transcriptase domain-containing protein n=1 Tax=Symbiodinium natans TaxID=878477 RepID=A0A812MQE2_9DINO|nr:unnamed protein product [Symbiodinium natans]